MIMVGKYIIGILILGGFAAIIYNCIKSIVETIRARRDKRKSPVSPPAESAEKQEESDRKGGAQM